MCYAIPAKIIAIENDIAVVDYFGEQRRVLLDLPDIGVGDYIYAQGGVLVRKIPESEAIEILATWQEAFFELKKTDEALSKLDKNKLSANALQVLQKVNLRKSLRREEMVALFELQDSGELKVLYEIANNVRQREHGNASCVHGIIEFSNYCSNNCHYCGIRCDSNIQRYRIEPEEIIAIAKNAVERYGFKALVLQSGEDYWYDEEKLVHIVSEVRKLGVLVFVSLGLRSKKTYKALYEAGARAALLRFETSNPEVFAKLRPGTTLEKRVELIKYLKKIGYVLATGFIIGLPGTTTADTINDLLLTKYLAPDMYSYGPLIPTQNTPLAQQLSLSKEEVLKTIAINRFIDADCNILVTSAVETLNKSAKREALLAGANSLMINVTPYKYRQLYNIYDNKAGNDIELMEAINNNIQLLYSLGRAPTDIGL